MLFVSELDSSSGTTSRHTWLRFPSMIGLSEAFSMLENFLKMFEAMVRAEAEVSSWVFAKLIKCMGLEGNMSQDLPQKREH